LILAPRNRQCGPQACRNFGVSRTRLLRVEVPGWSVMDRGDAAQGKTAAAASKCHPTHVWPSLAHLAVVEPSSGAANTRIGSVTGGYVIASSRCNGQLVGPRTREAIPAGGPGGSHHMMTNGFGNEPARETTNSGYAWPPGGAPESWYDWKASYVAPPEGRGKVYQLTASESSPVGRPWPSCRTGERPPTPSLPRPGS